jgi:hypothetical protein
MNVEIGAEAALFPEKEYINFVSQKMVSVSPSSFLCDDMQLSYYGQLWSTFNLLTAALQRQNVKNLKQIFPEKEYRGLSPNIHIHVSVSELYIPTMGLPVLLEEIYRLILGIYNRSKTHECGNWG